MEGLGVLTGLKVWGYSQVRRSWGTHRFEGLWVLTVGKVLGSHRLEGLGVLTGWKVWGYS